MTNNSFINKISVYMPGEPIENDSMEDYLGFSSSKSSKVKRVVLKQNGIKKRHYALDKEGNVTHTSADLAAEAIKNLIGNDDVKWQEVDLLSCATSCADQIVPSHGVMVHGLLKNLKSIEVTSSAGTCCSGIHALNHAQMAVKFGVKSKAIASASENSSIMMRNQQFEKEVNHIENLEKDNYLAFQKEFLRWMLSDGASAVLIEAKPNEDKLSLKIDWIECVSFASISPVCMYAGATKFLHDKFEGFTQFTPEELSTYSVMSFKQDVKVLKDNIMLLGVPFLKQCLEKHNVSSSDINYFLPHVSSYFFRKTLVEEIEKIDLQIDQEKWFMNLDNKGNVGSVSTFIALEELFNNGSLKVGERIILLVPESARFSYAVVSLTVC